MNFRYGADGGDSFFAFTLMPIKTFIRDRFKTTKHRLNGVLKSRRLPKSAALCQNFRDHTTVTPDELPPKVDLRHDMTPVEDQSKIGSW
jgi:hypothetical protein